MPQRTPARYRWFWYFLVLGVLTAGGITANLWYNVRQQLTPEQLDAARRLWSEKGPRDYRLDYTIKREINPDPAGTAAQRYTVEVRNGQVASVTDSDGRTLKAGDYEWDSMDSLFDFVAGQLRTDEEPGQPRAFVKANFDGDDGHITHYVHSIMRTRERLEVQVELSR